MDAAVIKLMDNYLIVSSDPITAASQYIGLLAVNITTNDVAVMGGLPKWFVVTMLLKNNITTDELNNIVDQISKAASKINVALIGGHTEVTPYLNNNIIIGTAIGISNKYIVSSDACVGDAIIFTKGVAIEGTGVIANEYYRVLLEKGIDKKVLNEAKKYIEQTSVVKEAMLVMDKYGEYIHAMHDPTEGGIFAALHEVADASNKGLEIYLDRIKVNKETKIICDTLNINPYALLGSGSLLIISEYSVADEIVYSLKKQGIWSEIIGVIKEPSYGRWIIDYKGKKQLPYPEKDEIWKLF